MLFSIVLLGCGQGPAMPTDGSMVLDDAGGDAADVHDAGPMADPPNIPWLEEGVPPIAAPMLTPCPEGRHEVLVEDPDGGVVVRTCDPYGNEPGGSEPDICPDGWARFIGDAGCAPVGAPCPAGDFPEGLPTDVEVLYVLATAPPGGDGSRASPLSTIAAGLGTASGGTVIALGKGTYDEAVRLPQGANPNILHLSGQELGVW